jgi:2-oxoglutarate dehydrogenase E1 component
MDNLSYINNTDIGQLEELYKNYKDNPSSVDYGWQKFFEGFELGQTDYSGGEQPTLLPSEFKVINLIMAYRQCGHLFTKTNPVRTRRQYTPTLDIENFGLDQKDLQTIFKVGNELGIGDTTLEEILAHLQQTYCRSIGVEYTYIRTPEITEWLKQKMEGCRNTPSFSKSQKLHILEKLSEAVVFEKFIHTKFPGQKSFSLSGSETLVPALATLIETGTTLGAEDFIIGMAHRGRLNVLANILHKAFENIFSEFRSLDFDDRLLLGDVKYHLGHSSETTTKDGKKIRLGLVPNPSHLESVNPVLEGIARAKIDNDYNGNNNKVIPVLIHGDASIAGQGIIYEVLQMSQLEGYKTGGSIHLVINNQLGFTTNYLDGRSSTYCTDVAKTLRSPVFHVNADDVEAVVYTLQLAVEFRQKFHRDIFIDLLGYRRFGHNEGDEPRYSQPLLYKLIEKHPDPAAIYIEKLVAENIIDASVEKSIEQCLHTLMEERFSESMQIEKEHIFPFLSENWKNIRCATSNDFEQSPITNIDKEILLSIGRTITEIPQDVNVFKKIVKLLLDRKNMLETTGQIDWAFSEQLAFASLLNEGNSIRFSGQDSKRGTFSQRHAIITLEDSEKEYVPLSKISKNNSSFSIYNSLLSEFGVLGFEYGYAMASPDILTIWEAQYGDFANGAQTIIDQFLCCAEEKWNVMNGLVLLLPHGYEGQGPDHSSARIERFLTLCADNNMQVANCSTPANYFHLLRRQLRRNFRKPLIVFTPKSLLRHPLCVSPLEDFINASFKEIINEEHTSPMEVKRLLFCSGKIAYDLIEEKQKRNDNRIAIIRIEQLYPMPNEQFDNILSLYPNVNDYYWVQEEPENMGAWKYMQYQLQPLPVKVISRPPSGSSASGSASMHLQQQKNIIDKAFEF